MKNKLIRGKEFLAEKLDIPIDVMIDIPKIILLGKEELTIENHKGIIAFSEKEIKVLFCRQICSPFIRGYLMSSLSLRFSPNISTADI